MSADDSMHATPPSNSKLDASRVIIEPILYAESINIHHRSIIEWERSIQAAVQSQMHQARLIPRKARWVSGSGPKSKWLFEKMLAGSLGEELAAMVWIHRFVDDPSPTRGFLALRGEPGKHAITHGHHLFVIRGNETLNAVQKLRNKEDDLKIDIEDFRRA